MIDQDVKVFPRLKAQGYLFKCVIVICEHEAIDWNGKPLDLWPFRKVALDLRTLGCSWPSKYNPFLTLQLLYQPTLCSRLWDCYIWPPMSNAGKMILFMCLMKVNGVTSPSFVAARYSWTPSTMASLSRSESCWCLARFFVSGRWWYFSKYHSCS